MCLAPGSTVSQLFAQTVRVGFPLNRDVSFSRTLTVPINAQQSMLGFFLFPSSSFSRVSLTSDRVILCLFSFLLIMATIHRQTAELANAGEWLQNSQEAFVKNSNLTIASSLFTTNSDISKQHMASARTDIACLNVNLGNVSTSKSLLQLEHTERCFSFFRFLLVFSRQGFVLQILLGLGDFQSILFYTVQQTTDGFYVRYIATGQAQHRFLVVWLI